MDVGAVEKEERRLPNIHTTLNNVFEPNIEKYMTLPGSSKRYVTDETYNGKISLMCPHCFNLITRYMRYHVASAIENSNFSNDDNMELCLDFIPSVSIAECPSCKSEFVEMIMVDPGIAYAISIFNKKGYFTKFCCEGHRRNEGEESLPYVYFSNKKQMEKVMHLIPISWYVDYSDILDCNHFIIRADLDNRDEALIDLLEWAKSLPYADPVDISKTLRAALLAKVHNSIHDIYELDDMCEDTEEFLQNSSLFVELGYKLLGL